MENRLVALAEQLYRSGRNKNLASIFLKIQDVVSQQFKVNWENVTLDSHILNDLKADGLDVLELALKFEEEFDIEIPEHILGVIWHPCGIKVAPKPVAACTIGELLDCIYKQVSGTLNET